MSGLASGEEAAGRGRHDGGEDDDALAPPDGVEVVAQAESFALRRVAL